METLDFRAILRRMDAFGHNPVGGRRAHARRRASSASRRIPPMSLGLPAQPPLVITKGRGTTTPGEAGYVRGGRVSMLIIERDERARARARSRARVTYMKIIAKYTRVGFFSSDRRPGAAFSLIFFSTGFGFRFYNVHVFNICCSLRSEARRGKGEAEVRKKEACVATFVQSVPLKLRRDFVCAESRRYN